MRCFTKWSLHVSLMGIVPICSMTISAQEYQGTSGLLHVPSGEIEPVGTFRGLGMSLDKRSHPLTCDDGPYRTFRYGMGIVACEWLEMSFVMTLLKEPKYGNTGPIGYYNQDRFANIKLRPLKEGPWWPAVAVGWDDVGNFRMGKSLTANNHFENIYVAASKHYVYQGHIIGAHLAYRYYPSKENRDHHGIVGGVTVEPSLKEFWDGMPTWVQRPRVIAEWDGAGVNVGADVLLWRHLFIQASIVHGHGFTGGLSYHYTIPF